MKRLLIILLFATLPFAKAQSLEFSVGYPLMAQVAISGVALSEALSFGVAASFERLRLSANAGLEIAPIGSLQANASLEWAFVGRFRAVLATRATLGSATLNLGLALWSAAPANFDPFEIYAAEPLPNSAGGSRFDVGLGLRISRSLSLFTKLNLGSDASSNSLQLRYRSNDLDLYGGLLSATGANGEVYLLQSGLTLPFEAAALVFSLGAGVGLLNNNLTYEANLGILFGISENIALELYVVYQPWRSEVLPFRSSLELSLSPGLGTVLLSGFAGLNQQNIFNWGLRLTYRVALEELFPASSSAFRLP